MEGTVSSSNSTTMSRIHSQGKTKGVLSSAQARRNVASAVANAMLDAVSFDEDSTLVMDYACGSGALSQRLAPYAKSILGVDINPDAVEQYNAKVANQGISTEEIHAICVDLDKRGGELEGKKFDVVVCSQAYHHFPSIDETTRLLATFLEPQTGALLVSDLLKGEHADEFRRPCTHSHDHHHVVAHRGGLTEREVRESFERAGLVRIEFEVVETVRKDGRNVEIFLAQGVRPAEET